MRALVDFAIAGVDFARAESRRVRHSIFGLGVLLALSFVAGLLVFFGLAAILSSIFLAMSEPLSPAVAALLTGAITILLAGAMLWITKRLAK